MFNFTSDFGKDRITHASFQPIEIGGFSSFASSRELLHYKTFKFRLNLHYKLPDSADYKTQSQSIGALGFSLIDSNPPVHIKYWDVMTVPKRNDPRTNIWWQFHQTPGTSLPLTMSSTYLQLWFLKNHPILTTIDRSILGAYMAVLIHLWWEEE